MGQEVSGKAQQSGMWSATIATSLPYARPKFHPHVLSS